VVDAAGGASSHETEAYDFLEAEPVCRNCGRSHQRIQRTSSITPSTRELSGALAPRSRGRKFGWSEALRFRRRRKDKRGGAECVK